MQQNTALMLSGGEALIKALREQNVECIFGYPGGAALHIYDALFRQNKDEKYIKHYLVRHEQAATHAADAYSRSTNKIGVVLVTSGPGATNTITGIATAYMDSIPLIVISAQIVSDKIGEDAFQETDMVGISRPIVKHSFLVTKAEDIPLVIKQGFHIARSGRPGPVVIDITKDATLPTDKFNFHNHHTVKLRSYAPPRHGNSRQIQKAINLIKTSKRPIMYVGGGAVLGDASDEIRQLSSLLKIPVTQSLMGLGVISMNAPEFVGMLGMHGTYEANMAMHHSDLIIGLGVRFDDRTTNDPEKYCPDAKIIHVDIDPASIGKIIKAYVPVVGHVKLVTAQICNEIKQKEVAIDADALQNWWETINIWRQQHGIYHKPNYQPSEESNIKPQDVIKLVNKLTNSQAIITSDVGQHQMFTAQYYHFVRPKQWINSGGLGTMGFGLPAAMGAAIGNPEQTVICITSEGSVQMCIQELSTCKQYGVPIKILVINNQSLGMVKQWQDINYSSRYSESLYEDSMPDFIKLAEAFHAVGLQVRKLSELQPKMQQFLDIKDKPVILDVLVDANEHVYPMQIAGGPMNDMWVDKQTRV